MCSIEDQAAVFHHEDTVCYQFNVGYDMGGEKDDAFLSEPVDHFPESDALFRIKSGCGLVEHKKLGPV